MTITKSLCKNRTFVTFFEKVNRNIITKYEWYCLSPWLGGSHRAQIWKKNIEINWQ